MTPSFRLTCVISAIPVEGGALHGVVVVLGGHLHPTGGEIANRVVPTVVAERELVGPGSERRGEELVAEADPEDRNLADQVRDYCDLLRAEQRDLLVRWKGRPRPDRAQAHHQRACRSGRR